MNRKVPALLLAVSFWHCAVTATGADERTDVAPDMTRYIQRTMRQLAGGTREQKSRVRILFYGQSITRQDWWHDVIADLRKRFPNAEIEAANLAIGGFAAQRLVMTAARDIGDFYPDLVVFHVYGDHAKYEEIIRTIRSLTTAEIAIQTDHFSAKMVPDKPDDGWTAFMNDRFLPAVAATYHCDLIDVRSAWRRWLLDNGKPSQELLADGVHLNAQGCALMGRLVAGALRHDPGVVGPESASWIRDHVVGKDVRFDGGRLRLEFDGNRAVAVMAAAGPGDVPARV